MMFSKKVQSIVFSVTMFLLSLSTSARAFTTTTRLARPASATATSVTARPFFTKLFSDMMGIHIDEQEQILKVTKTPNAVILDVRSEDEIVKDGALDTKGKVQWYQVNCSPMGCPLLNSNVATTNMIPDKNSKCCVLLCIGKDITYCYWLLVIENLTNNNNGILFLFTSFYYSIYLFIYFSAPIVIHCATGKRSSKAKEILQNQGYVNVVNAGGFGSLGYLQEILNDM